METSSSSMDMEIEQMEVKVVMRPHLVPLLRQIIPHHQLEHPLLLLILHLQDHLLKLTFRTRQVQVVKLLLITIELKA